MATSTTTPTLGRRFVEALAARDRDGLTAVLHPHVDFRGMTPNREQLRFRFTGNNAEGPFVVEQQAYLSERDDRIGWMRVVCSGFRRPS